MTKEMLVREDEDLDDDEEGDGFSEDEDQDEKWEDNEDDDAFPGEAEEQDKADTEPWWCDLCGREADPLYHMGGRYVCERCRDSARRTS
jgi:hypothetical protein